MDRAFAATVAWVTGRTPWGSDELFRVMPVAMALVVLLPRLQAEMRGCRTSRSLLLVAAVLWAAGGLALLSGESTEGLAQSIGWTFPAASLPALLLLVGTASAFSALLFHARHVVYESVEPPEPPVRKKRAPAAAPGQPEETEKPKRNSARRASRAKPEEQSSEELAEAQETPVEAKPVPKPHFSLKSEPAQAMPPVLAKPSPKPEQPKPEQPKPEQPKPEPPRPTPKAAAPSKQAASDTDGDWSDDAEPAEANGRTLRLDGPEDPLRGLSKRERRKLRKAMKGQGRDDE
jgi:hypothetical protein